MNERSQTTASQDTSAAKNPVSQVLESFNFSAKSQEKKISQTESIANVARLVVSTKIGSVIQTC